MSYIIRNILAHLLRPAAQDAQPVSLIARDRGDGFTRNLPRHLALSADNAALGVELPLHVGTRRNLWQYTEDLAANRYTTVNAAKQVDTITVDGIALTRLSAANFYSTLYSNLAGLGLTPFVVGERYLVSAYVLLRSDAEQFFWMRPLVNGGSQGHGAKLMTPGRMRRVWYMAEATSTSQLDHLAAAATELGSGAGLAPHWFFQGHTDSGGGTHGAAEVYVGGFMFEKLASNAYKDGIAVIGDSTMAGASGGYDNVNPAAREVSVWLGGLLNVPVFNRAVGGEATNTMDARWAADITPLAPNCKYVLIQGGINDINAGRALADIQASIGSMVAKAAADGMLPVLLTCTPFAAAAADAAKEALRLSLNAWLKAAYPRVIDIAAVVADPYNAASLRHATGWYGDGTHYGAPAKRAVAAYMAQWSGWEFVTPSPYQPIAAAVYAAPGSALTHNGLQVIGPRETGWTAGTGTPNKGAFAADAATAAQAAQRVLALEQAMRTHGLIN